MDCAAGRSSCSRATFGRDERGAKYAGPAGGASLRILHVASDLDNRQGGPTAACIGLAKLMARRGHQVRIVTTDRGYAPVELGGLSSLEIDALPRNWPKFFGTSWAMASRLQDVVADSDVVHLHSLYLFHDWAAAHYCWRYRKPYIVRPHGTLDPYIYRRHRLRKAVAEGLFQSRVLRRAAGLHYTATDEWLLARPYARNLRGSIIPIGVDLRSLDNLPAREELRTRYPEIGDRKVVLFLGRLSFKKGVDILISAFAKVARHRRDIFLIVAGPDEGVRAQTERQIAELGIGPLILFTGMVTGADKRMILGGSDIFVLPSQSENFGIAVVEAAACGIPVVISDRINLWREFQQADAALVAPPEEAAFAAHMGSLLANPDRARDIGRNGAALVRRGFDWEALADRYEAMYETAARSGALPELA